MERFREFKTIKSIIFNTWGDVEKQSYIILIDNIYDNISTNLYMSARTARNENGDWEVRNKEEILIKTSNNSKDDKEDSYFVDCSRLFKIEKKDFDLLIENNEPLKSKIIKTSELEYNNSLKIFNQIINLSNSNPPYITLSHISYDSSQNIITSELEYASETHLDGENNSNLDNQRYLDEKPLRIIWYIIRRNKYDYYYSKVMVPLASWIRENKFIDNNKTTKDIIESHNKMFLQGGKKIANKLININDVNLIKNFRFAKKLKDNDLKYAQQYYDLGWSFEQFKDHHMTEDKEWLFDFDWLEKEYIEKKKKLERPKPEMELER